MAEPNPGGVDLQPGHRRLQVVAVTSQDVVPLQDLAQHDAVEKTMTFDAEQQTGRDQLRALMRIAV